MLQNDARLKVSNGTLGTIERIEDRRLTVRLDAGTEVSFSVDEYAHVDHGYAATVHKSQGTTVERTHVLATVPGQKGRAICGVR